MVKAKALIDIGVYNTLIPLANSGLCALICYRSLVVCHYPAFAFAAVAWLLLASVLTVQNPFFSSAAHWTTNEEASFLYFAGLAFLPHILFFYSLALSQKLQVFVYQQTPAYLLVGLQLIRLTGSVFLVHTGNTFPSWFGIQTGVLDICMGLTALPMAYLISQPNGIANHRFPFQLWNIVGLFDLSSAFVIVTLDLQFYNWNPSTVVMGFYPLSLLTIYQVSWAMLTHMVFLSGMDKFIQAQQQQQQQQQQQIIGVSEKTAADVGTTNGKKKAR